MLTQGEGQTLSQSRFASVREKLATLLSEESGQDLVEYGLIAGLIGLAAVTSTHGVAVSVQNALNFVSSRLALAVN
jgi:pilus assembly protein Flp/PilA